LRTRAAKSGGRSSGSIRSRNVVFGSAPETTSDGRNLLTVRDHAGDAFVATENPFDRCVRANLGACGDGGLGHRARQRSWAAVNLTRRHTRKLAMRLAHEQHERAAGRTRAEHRS
jgi:hypothetical protein